MDADDGQIKYKKSKNMADEIKNKDNQLEDAYDGDEPVEWERVVTVAGIQNATIIAGRLESYGIMTHV
ncbi:MAG: hypothetical protein JXA42_25085, partial [Anaerolineales bacterium]|nr:hypothetical protein [Anaerolineales bacterium]